MIGSAWRLKSGARLDGPLVGSSPLDGLAAALSGPLSHLSRPPQENSVIKGASSSAEFQLFGRPPAARAFVVAIAALALFATPTRANSLTNGGFDTVGPAGSPVTTIGAGYDPSAAAGRLQFCRRARKFRSRPNFFPQRTAPARGT
jgi:hypothetical protein